MWGGRADDQDKEIKGREYTEVKCSLPPKRREQWKEAEKMVGRK